MGRVKRRKCLRTCAKCADLDACAMYHPGLCFSFIHSVVSNDSFADSEGYCQTARMRRLIWAFKVQRHDFTFLHDMAYIIKFIFSGPSCSKIKISLVNVSFKLRSLNMAYILIFLLKQCNLHKLLTNFYSKNTCELEIVLTRTVNILTIKELVKVTTLWTIGPWSIEVTWLILRIEYLSLGLGAWAILHGS